jgi:hypothetical protein
MIEIDHNPHEKRPTNTVWWLAWIVVALLWVGQFYLNDWSSIKWDQVALGGITMGLLALWSLEMKGDNNAPSWMTRGQRRVRKK